MCRYYYFYIHFTVEETRASTASVTQCHIVYKDRSGTQTEVSLTRHQSP